jgi:AcrR family transcriptional regulator
MQPGRGRSEAIIHAARDEFDTRGFAGARVQAIADEAGVNKQLIFYYHGSKLGLFREVVRSSLSEVTAATVDSESGPQATKRLREQIAALYATLGRRPHISRLLTGDATVDRETSALADSTFATIVAAFADIVRDGQRLGYFRDDCDADSSARHAVSLVLGHLLLEQAMPEAPEECRRAQVSDSISRVLLKSLEW